MSKPTRRVLPVRHGPEGKFQLPNATGCVSFEKYFLTKDEAQRIFDDCLHAKSWSRSPIVFFGKSVMQPRDTGTHAIHLFRNSPSALTQRSLLWNSFLLRSLYLFFTRDTCSLTDTPK